VFAVPWLVVTYDELQRLPLHPRAGFVVSLIDGRCTVEMLLDVSGMREDETLDILAELLRLGAIELRDATYSKWPRSSSSSLVMVVSSGRTEGGLQASARAEAGTAIPQSLAVVGLSRTDGPSRARRRLWVL
jgi:hypothetical protein